MPGVALELHRERLYRYCSVQPSVHEAGSRNTGSYLLLPIMIIISRFVQPTLIMEAITIIENRFQVTLPDELKAFWTKNYKKTFHLYNWAPAFTILDPSQIVEEAIDYPEEDKEFARQIYTMVAIARENENDRFHVLAYAFGKKGQNLGIFLWNFDGWFEYPIFIGDSINDLVNDHVILFEEQDQVAFDAKKYLEASLQKYTKGFVLPLNPEAINDDWDTGATEQDWFKTGHEINTLFKKLVEFYKVSFERSYNYVIGFEGTDDQIFVKIRDGIHHKRVAYHIKEEDVYSFIEKLNDELNGINPGRFGRPDHFGFYLINQESSEQKYVACLYAPLACDLIQKGYMRAVNKMFPIMVYYNPRSIPDKLWVYDYMNKDYEKKKEQLTWISDE
jgi:hypothetical protein